MEIRRGRALEEFAEIKCSSCGSPMERLYRTVVQLEEAKKLVEQGDVANLRLALILLDNAVDVMMHRVIEGKMMYSECTPECSKTFQPIPLIRNEKK